MKYKNENQKETVSYLDHLYEQFDSDALMNLRMRTQEIYEQEIESRGEEKGRIAGRIAGHEEGFVEGRDTAKLEMVIQLLLQGKLTYEEMSMCSGLSVDEIVKIEKDNIHS